MALLAEEPLHGYRIVQRLSGLVMFRNQTPDSTGLYRLLKTMERDGLVVSNWEVAEASPPRRCYKLTAKGRRCLERWAGTLNEYRDAVSDLLQVVERSVSLGCSNLSRAIENAQ